MFVTGQMPFTGTANDSPYAEGIEAQTRQVMENLKRVLAGCRLGLEHVVAARIFLTHFEEDYAPMNRVYASYFAPGKVPRAPASRHWTGARRQVGDRLHRPPPGGGQRMALPRRPA